MATTEAEWNDTLGLLQCVCIPVFVGAIGMYNLMSTQVLRVYVAYNNIFGSMFLPISVYPMIYMAWLVASGVAFWEAMYDVDCATGAFGFDWMPWSLVMYLLWTLPAGLRLLFYGNRSWLGFMIAADLLALGFGITHFVMVLVNRPDGSVCVEGVDPIPHKYIYFIVFWGLSIGAMGIMAAIDVALALKPASSYAPVKKYVGMWDQAEKVCGFTDCLDLTDCQQNYLNDLVPGAKNAYATLKAALAARQRVRAGLAPPPSGWDGSGNFVGSAGAGAGQSQVSVSGGVDEFGDLYGDEDLEPDKEEEEEGVKKAAISLTNRKSLLKIRNRE